MVESPIEVAATGPREVQHKIRVRSGIEIPRIYLTHALLKTGSISKFGRDAGLREPNLVHWNAVDPTKSRAIALSSSTARGPSSHWSAGPRGEASKDQFVSDDRLSDEIHTNGYTQIHTDEQTHTHKHTHLTNTYMHTSVILHTSTHTLTHTHGQAHTIKHTPHLHTPTLTHSICLACLFPTLTLQHLVSAASIFRSCSHVGLSGPIIFLDECGRHVCGVHRSS